MAIRDVITFGFGSFGTVPYVTRLGFGSSSVVVVAGPFRSVAGQAWTPGCTVGQDWKPGSVAAQDYTAGSDEGQYI